MKWFHGAAPEMRREEILTEENLKELRRHLALQSPLRVADFYNASHGMPTTHADQIIADLLAFVQQRSEELAA